MLGDQDLYVIYPTTEKSLNRPRYEFPLFGNNTKSRQNNDCSHVLGMEAQDTIQFRLDDPTYENYQYTNDDDVCAVEIDGWEVIEKLGDQWTESETTLDVYFSRKDRQAVICPFDDS